MARQLIFTREVLTAISLWVELGATPADIASALKTTEASLRQTCSQYSISLRPSSSALSTLTQEQWKIIHHESTRRGIPSWSLIGKLLCGVIDNNLFAAVLDDYDDAEVPPKCGARL